MATPVLSHVANCCVQILRLGGSLPSRSVILAPRTSGMFPPIGLSFLIGHRFGDGML
jgi:hypothetical protein